MSKAILRIIPTMQSVKLARLMAAKKKTKKPLKKLIRGTTGILVGIPLIKETATQVEGF